MYVCLSASQAINYYSHEMKPEYPVKQIILLSGFYKQYLPLILLIGIEAHCALLSKKTKLRQN